MYPEDIEQLQDLGSKVICDKGDKQLRLAVSEFRDVLYISLRWWNLSFDEETYYPTKEGVTMPYTLDTVSRLWDNLVDLLSDAEVLDKLVEHGVNLKKPTE
jgi:hypothetical protein